MTHMERYAQTVKELKMLIEMWKDTEGFRLQIADFAFDLTPIAYRKLLESLGEFEDQDVANEEGTYTSLELDLEDK